ncbi:MAG: hypothetical protein N2561_06400 [Bacteroidetes bacterium]|nr:hypothetical protein [Rhodothermia bacterium]MCS7154692.1 hypothetical protein [Bacteroidota bacterium]MCX7907151.1 hypothetical protein [Bacteroidota bacterium]MDW8285561.1 hypothetical protein [Bacteroidota bacterium]
MSRRSTVAFAYARGALFCGLLGILGGCRADDPKLTEALLARLLAEAHLVEARYTEKRARDSAFAAVCRAYGVDTARFFRAYRSAVEDPQRLRRLQERALRWLELGSDTSP